MRRFSHSKDPSPSPRANVGTTIQHQFFSHPSFQPPEPLPSSSPTPLLYPIHLPGLQFPNTNRHSHRTHKPPPHLQDYICNSSSTSNCTHSIHEYLYCLNISSSHKDYAFYLDAIPESSNYFEARKHPCWVEAKNKELKALETNCNLSILDKLVGVNSIGRKWVYKVKRKTEIKGIDFFNTFSPVAKMATVRMIIASAIIKGQHIQQWNMENALLLSELKEDVMPQVWWILPLIGFASCLNHCIV